MTEPAGLIFPETLEHRGCVYPGFISAAGAHTKPGPNPGQVD